MPINQSDLDSFHHFASHEISLGQAATSWDDLLLKWQSQKEHAATVASIRKGVEDADAQRMHDLADVDARIRAQLGFPPRSR